jgi:rhodanese-related sulfurtransferase
MESIRATRESEVTRISVDEVNRRMDSGEQIYPLDTRSPDAWSKADTRLPGAIRVPPDEVEKHLADIPRDRTIVTYCT